MNVGDILVKAGDTNTSSKGNQILGRLEKYTRYYEGYPHAFKMKLADEDSIYFVDLQNKSRIAISVALVERWLSSGMMVIVPKLQISSKEYERIFE